MITTRPRLLAAATAALLLAVAGCSAHRGTAAVRAGGHAERLFQPAADRHFRHAGARCRARRATRARAGGRARGEIPRRVPAAGRRGSADRALGAGDGGRQRTPGRKDPGTIAYLGESETGASAVAIPILNEPGILDVSPTDTVSGFTRRRGANPGEPDKYYPTRDRNFARLVPPDDVQAAALLSYMQDAHVHRLFIVNDEALYGRTLGLTLQRAAQRAGLSVVATRGPRWTTSTRRGWRPIRRRGRRRVPLRGRGGPRVDELYRLVAAAAPKAKLFAPNALADDSFVPGLDPAVASRLRLVSFVLPPRAYSRAGRRFVRDFRALTAPRPKAMPSTATRRCVSCSTRSGGRRSGQRSRGRDRCRVRARSPPDGPRPDHDRPRRRSRRTSTAPTACAQADLPSRACWARSAPR